MRTFTLRSFDRPEGGALRPPKDGSASGGGRRPRTHDQGHRRPAGVVLPASELPPIASSCVYSSTFRLFPPGTTSARAPALARCLKILQPGDTLIVWKLDRLG